MKELDNRGEPLISGRRLTRNAVWNLVGGIAPMLVGLWAIPVLVERMGTPRFGVLTLAWLAVGYFSLFDVGLGRALTKLVAERLGEGKNNDVPALVWTSMALMAALGILGSLLFVSLAPWLVGSALNLPADLQMETLGAFYVLGAAIPIVITSTGLRGVLAAYQRFDLINAVRIPLGMLAFLGPLAVMPFSNNLLPVVATLGGVRLIAWVANLVLCLRVAPELKRPSLARGPSVRMLLSYGGWMTVSNVVSPVMVSMDRFLIGATISMVAVAYYATPYELITRFLIVPGALMGVLFPALSTALVSDRARALLLFRKTSSYVLAFMFPVVLATVTLAGPGLELWLGAEFAQNSSLILQLLAVGVLINSLSQVSFGMIQADGRPDLTAKLHLVELPFYLLVLWVFVHTIGIVGAAIAWSLRVTIDAIVLFAMVKRALPHAAIRARSLVSSGLGMMAAILIGASIPGMVAKAVFLVMAEGLFLLSAWRLLLSPRDRQMVRATIGKRSAASGADEP